MGSTENLNLSNHFLIFDFLVPWKCISCASCAQDYGRTSVFFGKVKWPLCTLRWEFIKENKKVRKELDQESVFFSWSSSCFFFLFSCFLVFLIAFLVEFLFSCFLDRSLARVLVFLFSRSLSWSSSCFLVFYFLVFFYKFPPQLRYHLIWSLTGL